MRRPMPKNKRKLHRQPIQPYLFCLISDLFLSKKLKKNPQQDDPLTFHMDVIKHIANKEQPSKPQQPPHTTKGPVELRHPLKKDLTFTEPTFQTPPSSLLHIPTEFQPEYPWTTTPDFRFITTLDPTMEVVHLENGQDPHVEVIDINDLAAGDHTIKTAQAATSTSSTHTHHKEEPTHDDVVTFMDNLEETDNHKLYYLKSKQQSTKKSKEPSKQTPTPSLQKLAHVQIKRRNTTTADTNKHHTKTPPQNTNTQTPTDPLQERLQHLKEKEQQAKEEEKQLKAQLRAQHKQQKQQQKETLQKQKQQERQQKKAQREQKIKEKKHKQDQIALQKALQKKKQLEEQTKKTQQKTPPQPPTKTKEQTPPEPSHKKSLLKKTKTTKAQTTELDEETKKVLEITDELLAELPDEIIQRFAQSEDFHLYEKVLTKYHIK